MSKNDRVINDLCEGYADRQFETPEEELAFVRSVVSAFCQKKATASNHDLMTFMELTPLLMVSVSPAEFKSRSKKHQRQ